jgi:hypothetical protein
LKSSVREEIDFVGLTPNQDWRAKIVVENVCADLEGISKS